MVLGALILGGSMMASSIAGSIGQYKTAKAQEKIARENLEFQKKAYEDEKKQNDIYEAERVAFNKEMNAPSQEAKMPTMRV